MIGLAKTIGRLIAVLVDVGVIEREQAVWILEPLKDKADEEQEEAKHICHTCKHYLPGEYDGSCGSYICKDYSGWEDKEFKPYGYAEYDPDYPHPFRG